MNYFNKPDKEIMAKGKDTKVVDKKKPKQDHEKKDKKKYL